MSSHELTGTATLTLRFCPNTLSQMRMCCCRAGGAKQRPQLGQGCLSTSTYSAPAGRFCSCTLKPPALLLCCGLSALGPGVRALLLLEPCAAAYMGAWLGPRELLPPSLLLRL